MASREVHKKRMLEYWGNPENDFIKRIKMHTQVLGITGRTFYTHFTPTELNEIEEQALLMRKDHSARDRALVYKKLAENAKAGDIKSIREFLDRTEGKVKEKVELTGKDGKDLVPILNVGLARTKS